MAGVLPQQRSLWCTEDSPNVESSLLVCSAMPDAETFAAMLDGAGLDKK